MITIIKMIYYNIFNYIKKIFINYKIFIISN